MLDKVEKKYSLKIVNDFAALERFAEQWDDLNNKMVRHRFLTQFNCLRLSWQRWKTSWRNRLNVVLVFDNDNELIMAAPMVRRYDWFGTFTLFWLSSKTPLYDNVLLKPGCDLALVARLFAEYLSSLRTCRKIKIDFVYSGSPLHVLLKKLGYTCEDRTFTSTISLDGIENWQSYLSTKSANFRQQFNNGRNRIARAGGYNIDVLDVEAELIPELKRIFSVKRDWALERPEIDGWIVPQETEEWFVGLTKSELNTGNAKIIRLCCGDEWLASLLFFLEDKTLYLSKFAQSDLLPKASPGRMITNETVKYAIEIGLDEVDLMIGRDSWKDRMATRKVDVLKCRQSIRRL